MFFSIKTLGCKLNQYESSLIATQLQSNGWTAKPFGQKADLVIINTCTVTNKSDKKCRNYIRQGAKFSNNGKVIVTGCLAQSEGNSLLDMPEVSAVIGNKDKENFINIISELHHTSFNIFENNNNQDHTFASPYFRTRGLLKIQDGCDGECSYCIVPSVRGNPSSRNFNEIIEHAKQLIDTGTPELILTGITIGKYNSDDKSLADLVYSLIKIEGNFRVRISSIEPLHVTDPLIDILESGKVCSHLHIPLQSGSDNILLSMKRPYLLKNYLKIIEKLKNKIKNIAIGTDIIIGFPGESEENFSESISVIEEVGFSYVHQFSFSLRKGTPAEKIKDKIDNKIKTERYARMKEISERAGEEYRKKFLNSLLPSIIEKNKGQSGYTAVSDNYIKMVIDNNNIDDKNIGKIIDIRLISVERNQNTGTIPV